MAFIQVEASVRTHRKFLKAGPAASWLWLCSVGYCQDGLTDGFIPFEALGYLGVKAPKNLKTRLVQVGLWEEAPGGWKIHDYEKHNKSAAEVGRIKTERKNGGAKGGRPPKEPSTETLTETLKVSPKVNLTENPSLLVSYTKTDTETRRAPLHASHRNHAHCGRVCLPADLFGEFVRRRNHPDADRELRDWALSVEHEWANRREEPGDPWSFWKTRYAERWPAQVTAVPRKPWAPLRVS